MGKFIERPDLKTAFENMVRVWQKQNMRLETDINELIGRMRFLVESAEWKTVNLWISCSERLPETTDTFLAIVEANGEREYVVATYAKYTGHWIDKECRVLNGVTHWMPLPEPPKEDDND